MIPNDIIITFFPEVHMIPREESGLQKLGELCSGIIIIIILILITIITIIITIIIIIIIIVAITNLRNYCSNMQILLLSIIENYKSYQNLKIKLWNLQTLTDSENQFW